MNKERDLISVIFGWFLIAVFIIFIIAVGVLVWPAK